MSEKFSIISHKHTYSVLFDIDGIKKLNDSVDSDNVENDVIYIIDKNIARLYESTLGNILSLKRILFIDASEKNKSLDKFSGYINELVNKHSVRRGNKLVAIGGGITQDITCFLAATLMRGLPWVFYPTTLLAQADSCIGSKSSINSGDIKNILGTFTPPQEVIIDVTFLDTLEDKEIFSGIGEMLKVHAIDAPVHFDDIANNYEGILSDKKIMEKYIHNSLSMKKKLIELDEFDTGPRNVMNYGHSFGHAIESATNFGIPHGVAVTIGMDMANYIASELGISTVEHFNRMHPVMRKNYSKYKSVEIDASLLMAALEKDKKNTPTQLKLILPDSNGKIKITLQDNNDSFKKAASEFLSMVVGA